MLSTSREACTPATISGTHNYSNTQAFTVLPGTHLLLGLESPCVGKVPCLGARQSIMQPSRGSNSQSITYKLHMLPLWHNTPPKAPQFITLVCISCSASSLPLNQTCHSHGLPIASLEFSYLPHLLSFQGPWEGGVSRCSLLIKQQATSRLHISFKVPDTSYLACDRTLPKGQLAVVPSTIVGWPFMKKNKVETVDGGALAEVQASLVHSLKHAGVALWHPRLGCLTWCCAWQNFAGFGFRKTAAYWC